MTDRQAYISFLEVQLEKVTQAVMQAQGFNERIDQIQSQVNSAEDKIINVKRIVKLQQNYTEQQEEDFSSLKDKIDSMARSDTKQAIYQVEERLRARIDALEQQRGGSSFGHPRDVENLTREVDSEMKNTESRLLDLVRQVQSQLETRFITMENKILDTQTDYSFLEKKMATVSSPNKSRRGDSLYKEQTADENVEERLFNLEKELNKQSNYIKNVIDKDIGSLSEIRAMAQSAESTANRIGEDCLHRIAETKKSIREIETLAMATAEEVREKTKASSDLPTFERRMEGKVKRAINQMHDLIKRYISTDVKLPSATSNSKRKGTVSPKRQVSISPTKKSGSPSPRSSFRQKRDKSLTEIEEQFRGSFGSMSHKNNQSDRSLGAILNEPQSKSSRRPKSEIVKSQSKRRSSTPNPKQKKSSRSRSKSTKSINNSMLSPAGTTIKSRQMEAAMKAKIKDRKKAENKENRSLSARRKSAKSIKTPRKSKLEKIYQEITAKRRSNAK